MFIIPLIGWRTAGDMTVSLSGAGVEGVVVKVAIGDGSWREVGEAGGGGVVVGGPEVGRPALEVGGGGAYLRVTNEKFAIDQKKLFIAQKDLRTFNDLPPKRVVLFMSSWKAEDIVAGRRVGADGLIF